MKLTDLKCKASKPNPNKKAPTKISDGDGLYFVVHSTGKKTWRFDYRYHGKQKTMSFGPYPLISLKEARDIALLLSDDDSPAKKWGISTQFLQLYDRILREAKVIPDNPA